MRQRFFQLLLPFCLALFLGACSPPPAFKGTDITGSDWGRQLSLTDHGGKPRQLADFAGKAIILFFGYTQCPDVCPTTLLTMNEAIKLLGEDGKRVQVLFVTVDPERDTPELLAQYMPQFNPSFIGLYGDEAQTVAAAREFKVFYSRQPGSTPTTYTVDHSTGAYAFDPQGRLRLLLRHGAPAAEIAADLALLLSGR